MHKIRLLYSSALILAGLLILQASAFAQTTSALPSPWSAQDIGNPTLPGSVTVSSGTFTIAGAGSDISGSADQFYFVYQPMTGDGEVLARVDSLSAGRRSSKVGVMLRETLAASSKHASAVVSAGKGVVFLRRLTTAGSSSSTAGTSSAPPRWLRLVRRGTTFDAYESANGQTWSSIGSTSISMAATIYVGLAVSSRNSGASVTATVSQVAVTPAAVSNQPPSVSLTSPVNGTSYAAPATIDITASASDTDGTIARVDFYDGSTLLGSDTSSPYSTSWSNVPAGSYTLTAVATDNLGSGTMSTARTVTVSDPSGSVPAPWTAEDVGNPAVAGSASEGGSTFTASGAGVDVYGTSDQFQFVHQLLTGDGEIVAKVGSLTPINEWSKAGIMMRETLAAGSRHAFAHITAAHGARFLRRTTTDGTTAATAGPTVVAPYWVRLVRRGDVFESYASPDGLSWTLVGSATISMPTTIYAGLGVGSVDASTATTGTFSNVTVSDGSSSRNQPPAVSLTAPASGASYTAPASVTVSASASDPDGTVSRVDFYRGSTLIASDTTSPYAVSWTNVAAGSYSLTAVATDNSGAATTSSPVSITVNSTQNAPPTVSLTSPVTGSSFAAPTTVALTASAGDSDGTVAKVDFYAGAALVGSDTTSPYGVNWVNAGPGTYTITARATDNSGAVTTSTAVSVTLRPSQALFSPSVDDATVTSYRLDIFASGADPNTATPVATSNLGKPAPVSGTITVDITTTLQPLVPGTYIATVSAVNAGGSSRSAAVSFVR